MIKKFTIAMACIQFIPKVFGIVQTKFQQYQDSYKAKQLYQEGNLEQTTVFQGDKTLEQHKQIVFQNMEDIQKQIIEFLKIYNFQKTYNTQEIKRRFFNEEADYCMIDLQEISKKEFSMFTINIGNTNKVMWLNKAITKIYLLLILYYQGRFKQINKEDEFLLYSSEILEFIQFNILKRVKYLFPEIYGEMEQLLQYFCEINIQRNQQLDTMKSEFQKNYNVQYYQKRISEAYNNIIKNYNEEALENMKVKFLLQESLETRDKFKISDVLLNEGHKIIRKRIKYEILNSLQNYKKRDLSILMSKVRTIILKQIQEDNFVGGIGNKEINQNLQLIIAFQFWKQLKFDNPTIEILIKELEKQYDIKDSMSQLSQLSQFQLIDLEKTQTLELQDQALIFQKAAQDAQIWYQQNVDEETNLLVICQIYMILANLKFKNQKIYFGEYDSEARNTLFIIVEYLKDLEFGYFNHEILKMCEMLTYKLQTKFYEDIDQKIQKEMQNGQNCGELFKQRSEIQINNQSYHFLLQDTSVSILKSPSAIGKEFHQQHQLFELILKQKEPNQESNKKKQLTLLERKFHQIQDLIYEKKNKGEYKFVKPLIQPKLFYFSTLSTDENNSNVITLLICGFLSKNTDKQDSGKHLLKNLSGTVIALHWDTKDLKDFLQQIGNWVLQQNKLEIIDQSIIKNPFIEATDEAEIIGKYLAHYLDGGNLFGNRQINIVCHSLGTQILLDCVHELDRYSEKKFINDIVLIGGVADIYQLAQRRWNSVSGSIHNFYIEDDNVLKYLFKINYCFNHPCGYNPVKFGYKKVYNYNLTNIVEGHSDYWEKLDIIMNICDLNSDYKVLVKDVKKIF